MAGRAHNRLLLRYGRAICAIACAVLLPFIAAAQEDASAPLRVLFPEDFEAYLPVTARDALDRLPGLEIVTGDDQRGLGSGGNVLINGERAGGKSNTALDQLERLPASAILRVEVYAAGTDAFDAGGSSQVINVIINQKSGNVSGTYGGRVLYRPRLRVFHGDAFATASWTKGAFTVDLGFESDGSTNPSSTLETLTPGDSATPDVLRREDRIFRSRDQNLNFGLAWKMSPGQVLRFNALGQFGDDNFSELNTDINSILGPLETTGLLFRGARESGEFTLEYEQNLSPKLQLKLTALQSIESSRDSAEIVLTDVLGGGGITQLGNQFEQSESIVRARTVWKLADDHILTGQIEGAYNTLDAQLFFLSASLAEGIVDVRQPENLSSATKIEEYRGDGFVEHQWTLSKKTVLTTRLGAEISNLRVSGDNSENRTLKFPKPQVELAYQISKRHRLEFAVERVIGQLDFFDFAADLSLADNELRGSTGALRPQREWRNNVTWEMQLPRSSGRTSIVLFYDLLQDVIEPVPVSMDPLETLDTIGNIGTGARLGMEAEYSVRLGAFGLPDILLEGELALTHTRVDDPLTGEARRIRLASPVSYMFSYRHDVTQWKFSYGGSIDFGGRERSFEINQLIETRDQPRMTLFISTQAIKGITLRLQGFNLLDRRESRSRFLFDPNRLADPIPLVETRNRQRGRSVFFSLEGVY